MRYQGREEKAARQGKGNLPPVRRAEGQHQQYGGGGHLHQQACARACGARPQGRRRLARLRGSPLAAGLLVAARELLGLLLPDPARRQPAEHAPDQQDHRRRGEQHRHHQQRLDRQLEKDPPGVGELPQDRPHGCAAEAEPGGADERRQQRPLRPGREGHQGTADGKGKHQGREDGEAGVVAGGDEGQGGLRVLRLDQAPAHEPHERQGGRRRGLHVGLLQPMSELRGHFMCRFGSPSAGQCGGTRRPGKRADLGPRNRARIVIACAGKGKLHDRPGGGKDSPRRPARRRPTDRRAAFLPI